ncbi:hypothetical protein MOSE0_L00892 [Monosporozyma servazzii]
METTPENPETPLHAEPDEYLNLDNVNELDEQDIEDLDLNPDFDESLPPSTVASRMDLDGMVEPTTECFRKRVLEEPDVSDQLEEDSNNNTTFSPIFDNVEDFKPRINVNSPFSSSSLLHNNASASGVPHRHRRLSLPQQSKFISYVDQRFMDIQRKFVQSRGLNNKTGYKDLSELLKEIKSMLDFIWYSIDNTPNTDILLKEDENDSFAASDSQSHEEDIDLDLMSSNRPRSKSLCDFGQASYLIKIADDVMDYIEKFEIDPVDTSTISKIFKLFFILDKVFAKLISGKNNNLIKLNKTDMVRFVGIAERSRARLPLFFEHLKIHGFHFELSKIYETSLDLCAC